MTQRARRITAGIVYLAIGIVILIFRYDPWLHEMLFSLDPNKTPPWCIGWSSIGIGAGLINTRKDKPPSVWWLHYIWYYGFVLYIVSLASFVLPGLFRQETIDSKILDGLSTLIGLLGGFLGHKLYDLAFRRASGEG